MGRNWDTPELGTPPPGQHRPNGQTPYDQAQYQYQQHTLTEPPRSPVEALVPSRAPDPPQPRHRVKRSERQVHPVVKIMNAALTLLIVGFIGVGALIYYLKIRFDAPGPLRHDDVVTIPKGEGLSAIANRLERKGLISDRRIFVASVRYFKAQKRLKAGEFAIKKRASMRMVLNTLLEGNAILYKVTIPEGITSFQAVERLRQSPQLTGEINEIPPEGSLLPDTYKFSNNTSRADLIERMQQDQRRFIDRLWQERKKGLPIKTKQEALILASIVEKETGKAGERPHIAGVFLNRLQKKMRLQSDPTIIYGIAGGKGTLGRPILRSEITGKTPYNTYQIDGLPPTPIASPGRAAIEAVLRPMDTKDLYFVADGTGGHLFASNLRDHRNNVKNWRKIEAAMRARQKAKEARQAELAAAQAGGEAPKSAEAAAPGSMVIGSPVAGLPGDAAQGLPASPVIPGLIVQPGFSLNGLQVEGAQTVTVENTPAITQTDAGSGIPLPVRKPKLN